MQILRAKIQDPENIQGPDLIIEGLLVEQQESWFSPTLYCIKAVDGRDYWALENELIKEGK